MKEKIGFRRIAEADQPFLSKLYASTRQEEMDMIIDWTDAQKEAFLAQQFYAQHTFYLQQFSQADFWIVTIDNGDAGRLYIDRRPDEIRIVDIALLPAFRGRGYGRLLMENILAEGRAKGQPVRIHVEHNNRAMNLYRRLGFQKIGDNGVYFLMEWKP